MQQRVGHLGPRAAAGWAATHELRLARFGDNMRNVAVTEGDKTEAELRFGVSVNTWGVNDLVAAVDAVGDADVDALVAEYEDLYDVVPELRAAASGTTRCATAPARSSPCSHLLGELGATAFTDHLRGPGRAPRSCPASPSSG